MLFHLSVSKSLLHRGSYVGNHISKTRNLEKGTQSISKPKNALKKHLLRKCINARKHMGLPNTISIYKESDQNQNQVLLHSNNNWYIKEIQNIKVYLFS